MPEPPRPLRLTPTLLAQHFRFRCDRQLRWQMMPPGERPAPAAGRPGMGLLRAAGRRFERRALHRLVRRLGAERVQGAEGGGTLPYARVVAALREPGELRWLLQPELRVPPAFAERYGIPAGVRLATAVPDLLRVRRDRVGRLRLGVGDVKWSREGTVQHQAQVALYSLVLEEVCRAEGIEARVETRWGWLWTRGSRGPRRFPLPAYRHHVEAFLRTELPRIAAAAAAEAEWHLGAGCASCGFFSHCAAEAERTDHLSRVVGLTPQAARELRGRGIRTVRQLRQAEFRRGVYEGCEALESAAATLRKRVQALDFGKVKEDGRRSWRMGAGERVRAVLCAEADPVSGTVFALGLRVERSGGGRPRAEVFLSSAGDAAGEGAMLAAFLARVVEVAAAPEVEAPAGAAPRGARERPLHFFVWSRGEAELLRDLLQRHLGDPGALPALAGVVRLLFPGGGAPLPATVVLDVVSELFALPIPHAWDLASVSAVLRPADGGWTHRPAPGYAWPLGSGVAFERIHDVWRRGDEAVRAEVVRAVESRLAAVDSVVRAVREISARRRDPLLGLPEGEGAAAAGGAPVAHPLLEQLRLFTLAEAAEEAAAVRQLHALPTPERVRRFECVAGLQRVEVLPNGHGVFEFDEGCREAKLRPGDFTLVLTTDDGHTLAETDARPWLRRRLGVELVEYDLAASPPRLTLAPSTPWATLERERFGDRPLFDPGRVAVLDRAAADFNTARVVRTLSALDGGAGEAGFVLGALEGRVPAGWTVPLDAEAGWREAVAPAEATLGRPVLNAEQREAWRAPFERPVTVVWGPPGTGKTYLLAWTLIGMARAARAAGRPFRVLVSAATHRAIANVLARLAAEAAAAGGGLPLRIARLAGRGSEADAELERAGVEVVEDRRLPSLLAGEGTVVVGSTVWSLWKQMRAMNGEDGGERDASPVRPLFDLVVLDEASQMRVPDALVALSSLRRGGRLLLAGDDRQLPPIVHGRYPAEDTLFGSAFGHFAARFGRVMLRESRRMNRALVRWPRRLFYPGFTSVEADRRLRLVETPPPDPLDALLLDAFLRPEEGAVLCTYDGVRAGAHNALEAELVGRLARLARASLRDPDTGEPFSDEAFRARAFAVISPHRAQSSAILAGLARGGWAREALPVVDTVERMQGNEREMIVVSYAVADREYAEREAEFLLSPNRFNVSITRARAKLVVLLSEEVLRARPADEPTMTASMAVKGYPAHLGAVVREVEVPAPGGGTVRLCLRVATLQAGR